MKLKSVAFFLSILCIPILFAKQNSASPEPSKALQAPPTAQPPPTHRIHVKEYVQKAKLIHEVPPLYPAFLGRRVDGTVVLHVVVGKDGAVKSAKYVSGPETCRENAIKAVQQWRYEPTFIKGVPVEVNTTVLLVYPPIGSSVTPD